MRLRTLASIAAALLLPVLLSSPASAYDMGAPDTPVRLSAGLSHTAFVDQEGVLWTWGSNQSGQLGAETQETGTDLEGTVIPLSSRPLQVMEDVASVSAGADFTVALKTDGTLWAWGGNDYGQLGNGSTTPSDLPICVLDQVTAVSAGDYHVAALRADGSLWTWGDNLYGQLGDGTLESRSAPAKVLDQAAAVSAGAGSTAALLGDQTLWTWGDNLFGQAGGRHPGEPVHTGKSIGPGDCCQHGRLPRRRPPGGRYPLAVGEQHRRPAGQRRPGKPHRPDRRPAADPAPFPLHHRPRHCGQRGHQPHRRDPG